mmetsp:Transcript_15899/g.43709  ORF Transcript_15899/g.43709 Transcript_15899/m.43709 type:complete len:102 (-) Transcript_15899:640-945(-)
MAHTPRTDGSHVPNCRPQPHAGTDVPSPPPFPAVKRSQIAIAPPALFREGRPPACFSPFSTLLLSGDKAQRFADDAEDFAATARKLRQQQQKNSSFFGFNF